MKKIFLLTIFAIIATLFSACKEKDIPGSRVLIDHKTLNIGSSGTFTLTATVLPENASNKNVTWTSSNLEVATVGSNGLVTAINEGCATIIVTTQDGNKTACCNLTVSSAPLRIVQLCDPQLGRGVDGFSCDVKRLEKAVTLINELTPDLVTITGDMVHNASDIYISVFHQIIEQIKVPVLLTPGNHDFPHPLIATALDFYRSFFGEDFRVVECKEHCIISVNSLLWTPWWFPVATQEEIFFHDQLLRNALQTTKNKKQPIVILSHIPPFVAHVDENDGGQNFPKIKRREILNLCVENGVFLWLAGHTHTVIQRNYMSITLLNGETTSANEDSRPFGFRLITIYPNKSFDWDFIPLYCKSSA
jgi:Icc-related predicted phosphoesterase